MKTIRWSSAFKADYNRISRTPRYVGFETVFADVLHYLQRGQALPAVYQDHPLQGEWKEYRDCHLPPDLLLIYTEQSVDTIALPRLGTHSQILSR